MHVVKTARRSIMMPDTDNKSTCVLQEPGGSANGPGTQGKCGLNGDGTANTRCSTNQSSSLFFDTRIILDTFEHCQCRQWSQAMGLTSSRRPL